MRLAMEISEGFSLIGKKRKEALKNPNKLFL